MSVTPIGCDECRTLLGGYVLTALDSAESSAVRRHLAGCADCAREFAELDDLPMLLELAGGEKPAQDPLPARLEEAVLDRFAREHRLPPRRRARARRRLVLRPRRPLIGALAGAAAAAAIAIALATGGGNGSSPRRSSETYRADLVGASGARAFARLVTFSSGTQVQLRVVGLRATPGAAYELWCVRDDGTKVSAGTFRVDRQGRADVSLTTAAVPSEYHRLSVDRLQLWGRRWGYKRVLTGTIE